MTEVSARDQYRWKKAKIHFVVIAATMVYALAWLAQDNRFAEMNRELLKLERERRDLDEERDQLSLRIEHYRNPSRIRSLAGERFGLAVPDPSHIHDVNPNDRAPELPSE